MVGVFAFFSKGVPRAATVPAVTAAVCIVDAYERRAWMRTRDARGSFEKQRGTLNSTVAHTCACGVAACPLTSKCTARTAYRVSGVWCMVYAAYG